MNVLLVGGTGFIGSALAAALRRHDLNLLTASRSARSGDAAHHQVDITRIESLVTAMRAVDVVINCVSGDAASIADGARFLVEAARESGVKKIVHMSSMAVYGFGVSAISEDTTLTGDGNWYAQAKIKAESEMALFSTHGEVTIFRIGCVAGAGSVQWVQRLGNLLRARTLGDLGVYGDGWTNIVALDDVCQAVVQSVYQSGSPGSVNVFNLAAPDSPRWNTYLIDFAQLIEASPPARISSKKLRFDAYVEAPAQLLLGKLRKALRLPQKWESAALSPSLIKLFRSAGRLETHRIERDFSIPWTSYDDTVRQGAAWYVDERDKRVRT